MACLAGCNSVYTSCVAGFDNLSLTYWGTPTTTVVPYLSNPNRQPKAVCEDTKNTCVANCNGGGYGRGGGGGSAVDPFTEMIVAARMECTDEILATDVDGDSLITHREYLRHVEVLASKLCPGVPRPIEYNDEFQQLSCILCAGLSDPSNPRSHDGHCPCVDGVTPAGPIAVVADWTTSVEPLFYCERVQEAAMVSCAQPDRGCYDGCYAKEEACHGACPPDSPTEAIIDCVDDCNVPYHACLGACPRDTSAGGAGEGTGGGQIGVDSLPNSNSAGGAGAGAEAGNGAQAGDGAEVELGHGKENEDEDEENGAKTGKEAESVVTLVTLAAAAFTISF